MTHVRKPVDQGGRPAPPAPSNGSTIIAKTKAALRRLSKCGAWSAPFLILRLLVFNPKQPTEPAQAVSPSTDTLMSTTTSVCSCTLTVLSPTVLIGPLGIRTCALTTG